MNRAYGGSEPSRIDPSSLLSPRWPRCSGLLQTKEVQMKRIIGIVLSALWLAVVATQVSAQNISRYQAVAKCNAEALRQFPDNTTAGDQTMNRTLAYESCMAKLGLAP